MVRDLLSIIVPVYNCEKYIRTCVESIFNVGYSDVECILVDDGSVDKSGEICDQIEAEYNSVVVIHTENRGVSAARNKGVEVAKGQYIAFVDADDYVLPIDFSFLDSQDDLYCLGMQKLNGEKIDTIEFRDLGLEDNFIYFPVYMNSVCNKFFKKEIIEKKNVRFRSGLFATEDLDYVIQFIGSGESVRYIKQDYYIYRDNTESATNIKFTEKHVKNNYQAYRCIEETCLKNPNIKVGERFLKYLRIKILVPYLTENDFYNPSNYRKYTKKTDIWDFSYKREWRILTWCAQKRIDIVPFFYMELKRVIHKR